MTWGAVAVGVGTLGAGIASSRAATSAAKAGAEGAARSGAQIQAAGDRARSDVLNFFPTAQQDLLAGAGAAGDLLTQGIGEQQRLLSAGNVGAQGRLQGGFGQVQNALLGLPVDQQAFAPQQIQLSQLPQNPLAQQAVQQPAGQPAGQTQPSGLFTDIGKVQQRARQETLGGATTNLDVLGKVASGDIQIPGVSADWVGRFMQNLTQGSGFSVSSSLSDFANADSTKGLEAWLSKSGLNLENQEQMRRVVRALKDIRGAE